MSGSNKDPILPIESVEGMPSLQTVVLPSRAFFLSWKTQTIPARKTALEDALEHYREAAGSDDHGWQDMALLGLISEAMQLLEDLAYLAMAWDKPFTGLANYVRATVYSSRTPTNFWGEVPTWTDERLEVFAGLAGTNPDTGKVERLLEALPVRTEGLQGEQLEVMERARVGTVARLRRLLPELAKDWNQFSRYFQGFKHGALAISRDDIVWVDDAVEDVEQAEKHEPTVAVWMRRGEESTVTADFASSPDEIAEYVMGSGRMAAFLVEAFIESRIPVFDAVAFEDDGSIRGLRTLQIPWTIWLREEDLDPEDWKKLGRGPLLKWIDPPERSDSPPPAQ